MRVCNKCWRVRTDLTLEVCRSAALQGSCIHHYLHTLGANELADAQADMPPCTIAPQISLHCVLGPKVAGSDKQILSAC